MTDRRFAFICGCGHSGTSLLANMFAANPQVYVPLRETNTFLSPRRAWLRLLRLKAEFLLSRRQHLVEKTPRHVRSLDRIRKMVPGACIILMVRDGRDVMASLVKRHGSPELAAERWTADNSIVADEAAATDTILVRYEDLIENPRSELDRLCRFIEIPYSDEMLRYHEQTRLWFGERRVRKAKPDERHTAFRNWQINQPMFDNRGRWRDALSESDLNHLRTDKARVLMARFGYVL